MTTLSNKLLTLDTALNDAGIPHAFGGAIALAYCTGEPRATQDLDINIFGPAADAASTFDAITPDVTISSTNRDQIKTTGQTRAWWDRTPIDLFFNTTEFHERAAARVRHVPFADATIPVLDCTTLAVFKAFFNRTKDWADLEAMVAAESFNVDVVAAELDQHLGADDPRIVRLLSLLD